MKKILSKLFTKQFFIGIVVGAFLTIAAFYTLCLYWETYPQTDCDTCLKDTTP